MGVSVNDIYGFCFLAHRFEYSDSVRAVKKELPANDRAQTAWRLEAENFPVNFACEEPAVPVDEIENSVELFFGEI